MTNPRSSLCALIAVCLASLSSMSIFCGPASADADSRISAAYTAWDDYYFYAAFEVNDHNVISTNRTPISQPQEDDDIEIFLNTQPSDSSDFRTPTTYQMAISAGSGAYFSVGDGAKVPKAKLVLTYKYAVTIDGTLNDPSDNDTGFTVELAIPWQELGLQGPPAPGQTWGFNVISRNRESLDEPAQSFVSLSDRVESRDDIQNPSKWTKIEFISTLANQTSGPKQIYCPRVTSDTTFPVIDGVVRDGEWNTSFGYSFGDKLIAGAAPSRDDEPNISDSPFATAEQPVIRTPTTAAPQPAALSTPSGPDYTLSLPGGGEVHVGKLKPPPVPVYVPPVAQGGSGHHKYPIYPGSDTNPLAANLPPDTEFQNVSGPEIDSSASLALTEQRSVCPLILAPYVYNYPNQIPPETLLDQPIDGLGPAFGGNRAQWHVNQLADARRSGIDVLLPIVDPSDPGSAAGLAALVEAMKEMKAAGQDYPLLGVKTAGSDVLASVREFLTIVPEEFRAEIVLPDKEFNQPAFIVVSDTLPDVAAVKKLVEDEFDSSKTVLVTTPAGRDYLRITTVSPGGYDKSSSLTARSDTATLLAAWQKVITDDPNWVYVDSWNDFEHGTEIAASRQYGEQYADLTRISALRWSGADEWDAKYLQNDIPTLIAQKTIYTVSVRVENNGSIPWRAGEGYSLCYRWYKDGRLYDDSAPRLPIPTDIYPGQSTTVRVGVLAQNSFGKDIEPGRYMLVFDMVQGQSRWFSYVGSRPLRVPVRVEDQIDSPQAQPVVIGSTTPSILDNEGTYQVTLSIRNEGQETWTPKNFTVTLDGNTDGAVGTLSSTIYPGAIGKVTTSIRLGASAVPGRIASLIWQIKTPGKETKWIEYPYVVSHDLGASFAINDVPRTVKTGSLTSSKIAIYNLGPYTWKKSSWKVAYEWRYLDGVIAESGDAASALDTDIVAGTESGASITFKAPDYPGRYQLILSVLSPEGANTLTDRPSRGTAILTMIISVVPDKSADAQQVDLVKFFTGNGIDFETNQQSGDFDGKGDALPGEFMPPDATSELNVNPILVGKAGPPDYPSGYYSFESGSGQSSNHRVSFLYGVKNGYNIIASKGQTIDLPGGDWREVHILAASTGDSAVIPAQFVLGYREGDETVTVPVANWTKSPDPSTAEVGLKLPYELNQGAIVPDSAVFLGDYKLAVDDVKHIQRITLPSDAKIKVLAITVER